MPVILRHPPLQYPVELDPPPFIMPLVPRFVPLLVVFGDGPPGLPFRPMPYINRRHRSAIASPAAWSRWICALRDHAAKAPFASVHSLRSC